MLQKANKQTNFPSVRSVLYSALELFAEIYHANL